MKYRKVGLEFILLITAVLIFSNTYYFKTLILNIMGPKEMQSATKNMKFQKFDNITYYYSNESEGEKLTVTGKVIWRDFGKHLYRTFTIIKKLLLTLSLHGYDYKPVSLAL